jgi:hypothetical protein
MAQVLQHLGVSEQTFHRWRNQYGGIKSEEAKRLKELEVENAQLKRRVGEREIEISILREANEYLGKPRAPRRGAGSCATCMTHSRAGQLRWRLRRPSGTRGWLLGPRAELAWWSGCESCVRGRHHSK